MALTTAQKLKIKEGDTILVVNAPADYKESLGKLPGGSKITDSQKDAGHVHWFVKDRAQMEKELKKVLPLIKDNIVCWVFFPKGSSKIQADITRDKGWDELLNNGLQWVNLISFDETWSAFGVRQKVQTDKKKDKGPVDQPILQYVDAKAKTVTLPDDFAGALKKNKKQEAFFNTLSFTNKKEWVEWIVTAKKEETRKERVKTSVERLAKEWKNPANR
ncbi:MAG: YdeI/OmpD-associated family protein [Flavisolibacter sp.]